MRERSEKKEKRKNKNSDLIFKTLTTFLIDELVVVTSH